MRLFLQNAKFNKDCRDWGSAIKLDKRNKRWISLSLSLSPSQSLKKEFSHLKKLCDSLDYGEKVDRVIQSYWNKFEKKIIASFYFQALSVFLDCPVMGMENFPSNLMIHLKQMILLSLWHPQAFHNKIHNKFPNKNQQNQKQNLSIQTSSEKSNFLVKIIQFYLQKKKFCQIYQVVVS